MSTYTFAIMEVSNETFEEIKQKMIKAGYDHAIHSHENGPVISMSGVAVQAKKDFAPIKIDVDRTLLKELRELIAEYEKLKEYKAAREAKDKEDRSYHGG